MRILFLLISILLAVPAWADDTAAPTGAQEASFEMCRDYPNEAIGDSSDKLTDVSPQSSHDLSIVLQATSGGLFVPSNEEYLVSLRNLAELRNGHAQYMLSDIYRRGIIVDKDDVEALRWLRLAAENRVSSAQYSLGIMYYKGEGVTKDAEEAAKWFSRAAVQGQPAAQCQMGRIYSGVEGAPRDYKEAVKWFRMSAEKGDEEASFNLGVMYYNGLGVARDYEEAYFWFLHGLVGFGHDNRVRNLELAEQKLTPEQRASVQKRLQPPPPVPAPPAGGNSFKPVAIDP